MTTEVTSFEEFIWEHQPQDNNLDASPGFEGFMFESYGEQLAYVQAANPAFVWTVLEGDDTLTIVPGYQTVNRFGYFVTEKPHNDTAIGIVLSGHWENAAICANQFLTANPRDRQWLAENCEEQGILAAAVCYYLIEQGRKDDARSFINLMISRV